MSEEHATGLPDSYAASVPDSLTTATGEDVQVAKEPTRASHGDNDDDTRSLAVENISDDDIPAESWNQFTKATVLLSFAKLASIFVVLIFVVVRNFLEDDEIETLRQFLVELGIAVMWWVLLGIFVVGVITTIVSAIMWRHMRFALVADGIHMRSGVFVKKHEHVRWDRIQSVEVEQNLLGRLLKQGMVTVENAGGDQGKTRLGLLTLAECEALRQFVLEASNDARRGKVPDLGEWRAFVGTTTNELPIYRLTSKRTIISTLMSMSTVVGVLSLAFTIVMGVVTDGFAWVPTLFLVLGALWNAAKTLAKQWGTAVYLAHNGVRVRSGLVSLFAQTIAPGRVHAIQINQPLMWRPFGWWKLEVMTPSSSVINLEDASRDSVIIPVGTREEVERMLWVILPDLGVDDVHAFLDEAFEGRGSSLMFTAAPERSRWLDPIAWRSNGIALTRTAAVLRWRGFWRATVTLTLHEHVQALNLDQGPLERKLNVANIVFQGVSVMNTVSRQTHLTLEDAQSILGQEQELGKDRRAHAEKESLEVWRARVGASPA
ncbi:PH domain-containing protein [Arcanobacterium haemolyticum]|nr:PH domain-containing protein [Arcanobacterium haemolyticum]